jgi:hypothetical protein
MLRYLLVIFSFLVSFTAAAQRADSIFVKQSAGGWVINHKVKATDNIFSVARRYHVPPAVLADYNSFSLQQALTPGSTIIVPTGAYNLVKTQPATMIDVRRLYFRVDDDRTVQRIARSTGVTTQTMQDWNGLNGVEVRKGQVLMVGWVLYDATDMNAVSKPRPAPSTSYPSTRSETTAAKKTDTVFYIPQSSIGKDTVVMLTEGERQYQEQTREGLYVTEEKGTAAFFKRAGQSSNGIYFAFHNTAKRGTIIKVYNPGTEKTVYAKVIGTVPTTAAFYKAAIGLSADAMRALDVRQEKAWVEISYAP